MRRGPRLLTQLFVGNLLAVLPLLAGMVFGFVQLQAASARQQQLLLDGVSATRLGVSIRDELQQLERVVRQYRVLEDPGFRGVVDAAHRQLLALLQHADGVLPTPLDSAHGPVGPLARQLADIQPLLADATSGTEVADAFATSNRLAEELQSRIGEWLNDGMRREEQARRDTLRLLLYLGAAALLLTLLLAVAVTLLVAAPLRQLSQSIHRLGLGDWADAVFIDGPGDLVDLGLRLEWLRAQLIRAEAEKKAFTRNVTHELKTPLAAIVEATALLDDGIPGPVTAGQREVLALLKDNADALRRLIEQLLRLDSAVREDAGDTTDYPLRELVEDVVAQVAGLSATRRLQVEVRGDDRACRIERRRLRLALGNLLSNAVNHSPREGRVTVAWESRGDHLDISVTDDGEGVAPADAARVFEPFYTHAHGAAAERRGTGLGLAIARECAEQLGGTIAVHNVAGRGACFTLSLPPVPPGAIP